MHPKFNNWQNIAKTRHSFRQCVMFSHSEANAKLYLEALIDNIVSRDFFIL